MTAVRQNEFPLDPLEQAAAEDTADIVMVRAAPARGGPTRWQRELRLC